ncbi:MAG: NAD(P)-binding domain-containing protein [Oscillospiraceae bacterium]|nr:NAD(P)-binding domain-containing protein [Oscillospiraceae bacterium]
MKFGIIGFGNLGRSLASALIKSDSAVGGDIYVCEKSPEARAVAEREPYNAYASDDVNYVISNADVVFLAVKGFAFEGLSTEIDQRGLVGKTIVSCMAGETFEKIYSLIGNVDLVRAMPSLAIAFCDGIIAYTKSPSALARIFDKFGYAFETEPENIENVMAFSACGLGYAAYLIDAFAVAGEMMGFPVEQAAHIAKLTFNNAVERGAFKETVKAVSTPGGATEQGINYMNERNVHGTVAQAVRKAYERMA